MKQSFVIYDGDCGICEKLRKLLERLDWLNKFSCHPLQDNKLYSIFPSLTPESCQEELKLIHKGGKIFGGGDAVIRICFGLPLMAPLGWICWLPPLRNFVRWIYPKVAESRYRISSSCGLDKK